MRVKAQGTTGHQVERYVLKIEVGDECVDDVNDAGALSNEKPADSTLFRVDPQAGTPFNFTSTGLSRCTGDVDVLEFFSFAGEDVTVTLTQQDATPGGLVAEVGTRPASLNNPAVPLVPPVVVTAGGAPGAFTNGVGQQLWPDREGAHGRRRYRSVHRRHQHRP